MDREMATTEARDMERVAESLVTKGDVSGLSPEERVRYYLSTCHALGLNPQAQPFAFLRLNGKEVMYATRGATDQLAALHKVNRRVTRGPEVMDLAGTKVVFCVCEATLPNGRSEVSTAAVPLPSGAELVCNALMKAETKGKRRATLAILGLALLDESETDTLPASVRDEPRPAPEDPGVIVPDDRHTALAEYLAAVASAASVWSVWSAYVDLPDALRAEGLDPATDAPGARDAAAQRVRALGLLLSGAELQQLLAAQDAGDLARYLDGVLSLPARDPEATARWWVSSRGALPMAAAKLCYTVAARRATGVQVIDGATTKDAKVALAEAVLAYEKRLRPPEPPSGGGAPKPEAPVDTIVTSDGTTLATEPEMRAHLEGLLHPRAVEASWRKHRGCEQYALLAAERYAALVGTDCDTALRALEGGVRVRRAA